MTPSPHPIAVDPLSKARRLEARARSLPVSRTTEKLRLFQQAATVRRFAGQGSRVVIVQ